jgi:hypothetical protein
MGNRSVNNPTLTTPIFLRGNRCTQFAVNSWGTSQPAAAIVESSPSTSLLSVKWLT